MFLRRTYLDTLQTLTCIYVCYLFIVLYNEYNVCGTSPPRRYLFRVHNCAKNCFPIILFTYLPINFLHSTSETTLCNIWTMCVV